MFNAIGHNRNDGGSSSSTTELQRACNFFFPAAAAAFFFCELLVATQPPTCVICVLCCQPNKHSCQTTIALQFMLGFFFQKFFFMMSFALHHSLPTGVIWYPLCDITTYHSTLNDGAVPSSVHQGLNWRQQNKKICRSIFFSTHLHHSWPTQRVSHAAQLGYDMYNIIKHPHESHLSHLSPKQTQLGQQLHQAHLFSHVSFPK